MPERIYNFAAGPSTMPLEALKQAQAEFVNFADAGMSLFEMSHRGKIYDALHHEAMNLVHEVLGIPAETHKVLFLQGGATLQFAMIPMAFLKPGVFAQYVNTGVWATKAIKDAKLFGEVRVVASGEKDSFMKIPKDWTADPAALYVHITTNNTIKGTQVQVIPDTGAVPLFADMSSDIGSRPIDWSRFGLAYAGAQKNLAPAGMAVVIMRKDFLEKARTDVPAYMNFHLHAEEDSLYNTPPMFPIYMMKLVLQWVKSQGGLAAMQSRAEERAGLVYGVVDNYPEYFSCPVAREDRSRMNLCFRLPSEELEAAFIAQAKKRGMDGLKGHRSVGGCRASMYNAMPIEGAKALADFMVEFMNANPKA